MARRILSADDLLVPRRQTSLDHSVRTEAPDWIARELHDRWSAPALPARQVLFDWQDQSALLAEIDLVNQAQKVLDEASVKIAPSVLRIVLTVKKHIPDGSEQRAFLAEHLELDFRRISELCIVAESYGLLALERRHEGMREILTYGWSKALKLAHVPEPQDRRHIWEQACGGRNTASYRAVLEEIRRFRERKLLQAPPHQEHLEARLGAAREHFSRFTHATSKLNSRADFETALKELGQVQRELNRIKRALREELDQVQWEELAAAT